MVGGQERRDDRAHEGEGEERPRDGEDPLEDRHARRRPPAPGEDRVARRLHEAQERADERGGALPEQGKGRREDGVGDVLRQGERVEREPQEGEDRGGGGGHLSGLPSGH